MNTSLSEVRLYDSSVTPGAYLSRYRTVGFVPSANAQIDQRSLDGESLPVPATGRYISQLASYWPQ